LLLSIHRNSVERYRAEPSAWVKAFIWLCFLCRVSKLFGTHDSSDPLAVALRNAGCRRVVELDRGSHHPAFLHRKGTDAPPRADYESTTLWVLSREMRPPVVLTE
jgi:hypothetical protein